MLKILNSKKEKVTKNFALVGPPNVGKSTFFNKITWKVSPVANMDRYTTTSNQGKMRKEKDINIIDLPGLTSFASTGHDEEVTINYLLDEKYIGVINIISALSIHRDLLLTICLAEAGVLQNIVINMVDEAKEQKINFKKIELLFNVPVSLVSAKKNHNLSTAISQIKNEIKSKKFKINYGKKIESFLKEWENVVINKKISNRFILLEALLNKSFAINEIKKAHLLDRFNHLKCQYQISKYDVDFIETKRLSLIESKILNNIVDYNKEAKQYYYKFKKIDDFFMNPWIAIPGFLILMCLIYFLTFYQYLGGWIQEQFATNALGALQNLINDAISSNGTLVNIWLGSFVADGIIGGFFTIISFLPWIIILFICINVIEQIGILSRLSIVFDNILKKSGLSGRSFINLFVGIGCNIPSIMLSRNLTNKKERIVSTMCSSLVSCSARVVVYGFIANAIIGSNLSWLLSLFIIFTSIVFALIIAYFFSNTLFRKSSSLFIVQIPRWRTIDIFLIVKRTGIEVWSFLKRTLLIVSILNLIIWILMSTGPNAHFILDIRESTSIKMSFLNYLSLPFKYIFYPIGLGFDNRWSISLLAAFPAKEVAASTIETLFGSTQDFASSLFKDNHNFAIPVIISYLIMFTFYIPCLASVVVMKKEIGWKYTLINIFGILLISYCLSWIAFNFAGAINIIFTSKQFKSIPIILVLIFLIVLIITCFIHYYRTHLQNIGKYEAYKKFNRYRITYIILGIIGLISITMSTIFLLI